MVRYDEQVETPISIRVYDSDSFSFDAVEYKNQFEQRCGLPADGGYDYYKPVMLVSW